MGFNRKSTKPCPSFPRAFQMYAASDLLRPIQSNAGVTLFFRDTKLETGHYTLMWSMSKVMGRIAGNLNVDSEGEQEALKLWKRHLTRHSEKSIRALIKYFEANM